MSAKKFKFVSPGIFINEIDNSQLPRTPEGIGPIIIGRSERGPAMRPVRVESFSEFVEMFGNPFQVEGVMMYSELEITLLQLTLHTQHRRG